MSSPNEWKRDALTLIASRWRRGPYTYVAGGYTHATDGSRLLRVEGDYASDETDSKALDFVIGLTVGPRSGTTTTESVMEWCNGAEVVLVCEECGKARESSECPDCFGSGVKECGSCGHTHECETCNGYGECQGHMDRFSLDRMSDEHVGKVGNTYLDRRLFCDVVPLLPSGRVSLSIHGERVVMTHNEWVLVVATLTRTRLIHAPDLRIDR